MGCWGLFYIGREHRKWARYGWSPMCGKVFKRMENHHFDISHCLAMSVHQKLYRKNRELHLKAVRPYCAQSEHTHCVHQPCSQELLGPLCYFSKSTVDASLLKATHYEGYSLVLALAPLQTLTKRSEKTAMGGLE